MLLHQSAASATANRSITGEPLRHRSIALSPVTCAVTGYLCPMIRFRFSGTITGKDDVDPARWPHSDWRCLRVQWDASHATFRHLLPDRVSPWSIKLLALVVQHQPPSVSIGHKRSMPFDPNIRDSPSSSRQGGTSSAHKFKLFGKYII